MYSSEVGKASYSCVVPTYKCAGHCLVLITHVFSFDHSCVQFLIAYGRYVIKNWNKAHLSLFG